MKLIGNERTLAFQASVHPDYDPSDGLVVDIVVDSRVLTVRDNIVYVPGFSCAVSYTTDHMCKSHSWLQPNPELDGMTLAEAHLHLSKQEGALRFFDWGPTTDDISSYLIVRDDSLYITYFLYSEFPDYRETPPIIRGTKINYLDLMDSLRAINTLMQSYVSPLNAAEQSIEREIATTVREVDDQARDPR